MTRVVYCRSSVPLQEAGAAARAGAAVILLLQGQLRNLQLHQERQQVQLQKSVN